MDKLFGRSRSSDSHDSEHWMSVGDLMAGLMMVFLFITIAFMRYILIEQEKIKDVAVAYQEKQVAIYQSLVDEFEADLVLWDAEIDQETLSFQFKSPDVLFAPGQTELREQFTVILSDFFPRYLSILQNYIDAIEEVRIEGHTSSVWNSDSLGSDAYFNNMQLSQGRTRSVLNYVYGLLPEGSPLSDWVRQTVAAVGYSSSKLIFDANGNEDEERSRRVNFRVVTNAEIQIRRILELE
jgi:outer membrane protein OmpA-like peptidoglycan-associated protein